jgi:putative hydrolase of the HAD superfamily
VSGRATPPDAVIFDLDGVIRQWNDEELDEVEASFGLEPRTIISVAFGPDLGRAAITGRLTYREWMDEIRSRVIARHGSDCSGALDLWEANVGLVDTDMVELLREVRAATRVALLSNGTTRLRRDLHVLDLLDEFDVIFNTAEIGHAKPDPAIFLHVLDSLDVDAAGALFVDDLDENVRGAQHVGISAHRHTDRQSTARFLGDHGIPVTDAAGGT